MTAIDAPAVTETDHDPGCDVFRIAESSEPYGEPRHCDCGFSVRDAKHRGVYNWTPPAPAVTETDHRLLMPPHPGGVYTASALCSCGGWQYDAASPRDLANEYRNVLRDHAVHAAPAVTETWGVAIGHGPYTDEDVASHRQRLARLRAARVPLGTGDAIDARWLATIDRLAATTASAPAVTEPDEACIGDPSHQYHSHDDDPAVTETDHNPVHKESGEYESYTSWVACSCGWNEFANVEDWWSHRLTALAAPAVTETDPTGATRSIRAYMAQHEAGCDCWGCVYGRAALAAPAVTEEGS